MTEMPPSGPTKLPMVLALNTALLSSISSLFPSSPLPLQQNRFPAMLSTFPACLSADAFLGNPFEPGFPPWENHEPPFLFHPHEEPVVFTPQLSHEPVSSNSGSRAQNPALSSGSDDSKRNEPKTLSSGSDDQSRENFKNKRSGCDETSCVDDRKRRRMMSNRESARRSRMRKQKHLENLRNQASRLKLGNREQANRLRLLVCQTQMFLGENERLRNEAAVLRQRLWEIRQVLVVRQLQQFLNPMPMQNNHPTL
ncbi:basic leucine zipper 43-like [Salvia miltiorrhiza]|uniref:basic leucine zipper 43-like n=1 Tax=Salvia miltiorrhiza TaxID=226208 RepID=UPI0025AB9355|nr:basic leucine zipper 43-like [Salvia miltiorrhiza]